MAQSNAIIHTARYDWWQHKRDHINSNAEFRPIICGDLHTVMPKKIKKKVKRYENKGMTESTELMESMVLTRSDRTGVY
jgi:hypothetical protein